MATPLQTRLSRRRFIGGAALGALAAGGGVLGTLAHLRATRNASRTIRIGYITALSGVRANFGEADLWTLGRIRSALKDGLVIGGKRYAVEIVVRDNESDPNRSATVSGDLLLREGVDLLLIQDGDALYPAAPLCDVYGIPAISTMMPWQAFVFGRGSTPERGFPFTFHFFWGADDVIRNFIGMWDTMKTNRTVGTFYFDNPPGRSFADSAAGMPAAMRRHAYRELDAGFYKMSTDDFSNQVALFRAGAAQIVSGFVFADHFTTFWKQALQSGYRPQICTVAAAFLFPSALQALGAAGDGMSTEVWWTPNFPFESSITGQSARELAHDWESSTGKQWTQPLGYGHSLWEVALAALRAAGDPKDRLAVRDALTRLSHHTIIGPVDFRGSPIRNVARTHLVGGQWRRTAGGRYPFELRVVHNESAPEIECDDELQPLSRLQRDVAT
ncbi:MAG TPA: ABC transporter substrate-binding protein [Steroidobacteraceae bacterium]|nr:ABC transporter substrate-binding protein [Steroidobacteraceae bacterium]